MLTKFLQGLRYAKRIIRLMHRSGSRLPKFPHFLLRSQIET